MTDPVMSAPLAAKLKRIIAEDGPIPVSLYMQLCLSDPQHGYYVTREPFGTAGDFTTAPEISQLFGEMVGIAVHLIRLSLGPNHPPALVELGPGRGTLMADMLRTIGQLDRGKPHPDIHLVEMSPRLRDGQRQTVTPFLAPGQRLDFLDRVETLPTEQPMIIVGNEFLDALPIRQFVFDRGKWRERLVGMDDRGDLAFIAGPASLDPAHTMRKDWPDTPPTDGMIVELGEPRAAVFGLLLDQLTEANGAALLIDYGYERFGFGDTLQAMVDHRFDPPLAHPGRADLTSHVDFPALAAMASSRGFGTRLVTQGEFLLSLGLLERAGRLGHARSGAEQEAIRQAVERLAGPQHMGDLFKVLIVAAPGLTLPPPLFNA